MSYSVGDLVVCESFVLYDHSLQFPDDMVFEVLCINTYESGDNYPEIVEISLGLNNEEIGIGCGTIRLATDFDIKKSKLRTIFKIY